VIKQISWNLQSEDAHAIEMQKGWQAILDTFEKYVESLG
jgi:uncharacterized protein YndB with AHSA1/START domain